MFRQFLGEVSTRANERCGKKEKENIKEIVLNTTAKTVRAALLPCAVFSTAFVTYYGKGLL